MVEGRGRLVHEMSVLDLIKELAERSAVHVLVVEVPDNSKVTKFIGGVGGTLDDILEVDNFVHNLLLHQFGDEYKKLADG